MSNSQKHKKYTTKELANYLGVEVETIYKWCKPSNKKEPKLVEGEHYKLEKTESGRTRYKFYNIEGIKLSVGKIKERKKYGKRDLENQSIHIKQRLIYLEKELERQNQISEDKNVINDIKNQNEQIKNDLGINSQKINRNTKLIITLVLITSIFVISKIENAHSKKESLSIILSKGIPRNVGVKFVEEMRKSSYVKENQIPIQAIQAIGGSSEVIYQLENKISDSGFAQKSVRKLLSKNNNLKSIEIFDEYCFFIVRSDSNLEINRDYLSKSESIIVCGDEYSGSYFDIKYILNEISIDQPKLNVMEIKAAISMMTENIEEIKNLQKISAFITTNPMYHNTILKNLKLGKIKLIPLKIEKINGFKKKKLYYPFKEKVKEIETFSTKLEFIYDTQAENIIKKSSINLKNIIKGIRIQSQRKFNFHSKWIAYSKAHSENKKEK